MADATDHQEPHILAKRPLENEEEGPARPSDQFPNRDSEQTQEDSANSAHGTNGNLPKNDALLISPSKRVKLNDGEANALETTSDLSDRRRGYAAIKKELVDDLPELGVPINTV